MHWWILAVLLAYMVALTLLRNKDKKVKLGLAASNVVVATVLTIVGDCSYDKYFLIGSILTSLPSLNIIKSKDDEGVIETDNEVFKKAVYIIAGLGVLTLVIASFLSLSSGSAESNSAESPNIVEPVAEEPAAEEPAAEEHATEEFDQFLCANGYDVKMKVGHFDIPVGATEEEMAKILTKTN